MRRDAKPAKSKVEAKPPIARKARKSARSRVHDLVKRLTDALAQLETRNRDLIEAQEQKRATGEVLRVIASSPTTLEPVLETIVANAVRLAGGEQGHIRQFNGEFLEVVAQFNESADFTRSIKTIPVRPTQDSAAGRAFLTGRPVHIPDILADPSYRGPALPLQGRTILAVPLLREGVAIGTISMWRRAVQPFVDRQIDLVTTFADQAVIAIENVRLFTELQEKTRSLTDALDQQTATGDILRVISRSPTDVQPVFQAIVESAKRLLNAAGAIVFRRVDDEVHLAAHTLHGEPGAEALTASYPVPVAQMVSDNPPSTRAWVNGEVANIADALSDPEWPDRLRRPARALGVHGLLVVPMRRDGLVLGVITIMRREAGFFSDEEIALLKTFADQAVIAIENVRLFKELEGRNRDLTATSEILRVISSSPTDLQPVFDAIVDSAVRLVRGLSGAVYQYDGEFVHQVAVSGATSEIRAEYQRMFPRRPQPSSFIDRAILDGSITHIADVQNASELRESARHIAAMRGYHAILVVPMLREGVPIGAISVSRAEVGLFSDTQIALLQTFADQGVIAIENVRLFTELEARNRELTNTLARQVATSEVLRAISNAHTDIQPVFEIIARSARRLCGAPHAQVQLFDGHSIHLAALDSANPEGDPAIRAAYPLHVGDGSAGGRAIQTRSVTEIPDLLDEGTYAFKAVWESSGLRSLLAIPMLRDGTPIGTIGVGRVEPGRFPQSQIDLLQTFADQAVIALENSRLFKELQSRTEQLTRSVDQLTALGEVGRAVSSTLDLETVLTTIVSRAVQLSGLDGGAVFEYAEVTKEFTQRAQAETGGALAATRRGARIRKGEGVVGRTAITREPVQVADITVSGSYVGPNQQNLIDSGVRAILAVPMVREDRLIGCLGVSRNRPGEFPPETIELLRTFATQSALAIQNARLFHEIEDKSRQLEAASRHKSEFLANMSHELRTPLNAVIGFSEVLLQRMFGALNAKQDEYLKDIYASGQHLLSLINDILDLSKIEAGRMELTPAPFHLPSALENAVTLVKERASRHGIAMQLDLDPQLGELVGDERKVKQVLLNLLSNAVKFTPEGGGISLKASRKDGLVEIAVTDTGVGIAPEDHAAVFEEFRQVGTADKKAEGTGLGLTLAKKFVELHGGRIWVESEPGRGSTFTFTLPVS